VKRRGHMSRSYNSDNHTLTICLSYIQKHLLSIYRERLGIVTIDTGKHYNFRMVYNGNLFSAVNYFAQENHTEKSYLLESHIENNTEKP
jgi:hypothetical protein